METSLDDGLAQALVDVADGLDLETTLGRILNTAVRLTGAKYGALGVLREEGAGLQRFLYTGMTREQADRIGPYPCGKGVLGELIRHPEPLRLEHIAEHVSATGWPKHHPVMDSFLGLPIRAGAEVYGNIYLTDKAGGFDDDDERRLITLAAAAGVAISNAKLFAASRFGQQYQQAAAEMANAVLRGEDGGVILQLLARYARELSGCDIAIVVTPSEEELVIEVLDDDARGGGPLGDDTHEAVSAWLGETVPEHSVVWQSLQSGAVVLVDQVPIEWGGRTITFDRIGCFPIASEDTRLGDLILLWRHPHAPTGANRVGAVTAMAVQAAVSLELEAARRAEHRLLVFRDRDRIARDLHDLVVQRLFASGVSLTVLQRAQGLTDEARLRIDQLMSEIDGTISQIRETIFDLREGVTGNSQVQDRLETEVERMQETLGFAPALDIDAELTTLDADDVLPDTVAVVREGLSNMARHAHATAASVRIDFTDGWYTICVTDDGRGLDRASRRSGLANLAERAQVRGGRCEVIPQEPSGTALIWTVPLHAGMPAEAELD